MDKIKTFLTGNGNGDGYGYGYGDGDGCGYGYGYGCGYGYGYGYGYGDGDGCGCGDGDGCGYGDGDGDGCGYGNGNGDGDGDGGGFKLMVFRAKPVYYVDDIPCVFISIHGSCARVEVIDAINFKTKQQYIFKFNNAFAHGETIKKARDDAERKYYASLDTEQALIFFKEKFKPAVKYPNADFYHWHSILTGSCDSGKNMWMQQHGIELSGTMTVEEFIELTKDSYGGKVIQQLAEVYE